MLTLNKTTTPSMLCKHCCFSPQLGRTQLCWNSYKETASNCEVHELFSCLSSGISHDLYNPHIQSFNIQLYLQVEKKKEAVRKQDLKLLANELWSFDQCGHGNSGSFTQRQRSWLMRQILPTHQLHSWSTLAVPKNCFYTLDLQGRAILKEAKMCF